MPCLCLSDPCPVPRPYNPEFFMLWRSSGGNHGDVLPLLDTHLPPLPLPPSPFSSFTDSLSLLLYVFPCQHFHRHGKKQNIYKRAPKTQRKKEEEEENKKLDSFSLFASIQRKKKRRRGKKKVSNLNEERERES